MQVVPIVSDALKPAGANPGPVPPDGLTWTFYLRRDVRWHDGELFSAVDVEFTFNQIIYNEAIPTSTRAAFNFRLLDENGEWQVAPMTVEAIDDYTVQFVLPVSFAPFLRSTATAIYPQHGLGYPQWSPRRGRRGWTTCGSWPARSWIASCASSCITGPRRSQPTTCR